MWQGISTVIAEATFCLQTALSVWLWSLPAAIIMAVITLSLVWAVSTRTFQGATSGGRYLNRIHRHMWLDAFHGCGLCFTDIH